MKKTVAAGLFLWVILTFCGCAVKETSAFEYAECPEPPAQPGFYLEVELPAGTALAASANDGRSAVFLNDGFTVMEEIFPADSLEEALLYLTGQSAEQIRPLCVASFPQAEYRLAWTAAGENDPVACRAALFYDGSFYYALSVECPAASEKAYRAVFSDLLESVSLEAV